MQTSPTTISQEKELNGESIEHTFSAMMRSPISNVGYMDRDGMKRGSATNHLKRSETVKVMMMVLPSSAVRLIHLGSQLPEDFSLSSVLSVVVMESAGIAGTSVVSSQSIKTVSSSITWLLRETEVPLHQED